MKLLLNSYERRVLHSQDPSRNKGGWQSLMIKLQRQFNPETNEIILYQSDLERIHRYAFSYGNGGWEDKLKSIFSRHLGRYLRSF